MRSVVAAVRHILSHTRKNRLEDPSLVPAGVMLLLYSKDGEYCILLNKRTESVDDHKGEISFPGGRKNETDNTLLETALRETHEEMGIRPEDIEVLGELDDVATNTDYVISPFVGVIPGSYSFTPSEQEVAEVLEVPLSVLLDERSTRDDVRIEEGKLVRSPAYAYQGHLIFGATARVLNQILRLLEAAPSEEVPWKTKQA